MGFNAAILIRNSDLPAIEQDPEFGARVASVILGADLALHVSGDRDRKRTVTLSEVCSVRGAPPPPYEIQSAPPAHSGVDQIFLVEGGDLLTFRRYGEPMRFSEWERLARRAKGLSIFSSMGRFDSRDAPFVPLRTESDVMHGWGGGEFYEGVTTLSVIVDDLGEIRDDEGFGRSTAHRVRRVWADERIVTSLTKGSGVPSGVMIDKRVMAGERANAASVISITLPGEADIILVGGNWGRALRTHVPVDHEVSGLDYVFSILRERDVERVGEALLSAGFSVKFPGEGLIRSPRGGRCEGFVTDPPEPDYVPLCPPQPTAHEVDAPD